jgi:hypothetical protein
MKWIRRAPNGVLSIGHTIWMFTRIRHDDDYDETPFDIAYRQFVLHFGRFHITAEWRLK